MDNLSYYYTPTPTDYNDLKTQSVNNYRYDEIGDLVSDVTEGISDIAWTVCGKIKSILKTNGALIKYSYDAAGNRLSKIVTTATTGDSTYYVRDASGNVISVYNKKGALNLLQTELHLYGSSRLGVYNVNVDVQNCSATKGLVTTFTRGNKFFELSNHLGNVLATVSDKKLQVSLDGTFVSYYNADVVTANDYYPFGSLLAGRKYSQGGNRSYRYGFNGKENDNEVKGEGGQQDYGMRIYDTRLGRFLSVDPITEDFPELTPYQFSSNSPIENIDLDSLESISAFKHAQAIRLERITQLVLAKPKPREIEIMVWNPYRNQAQIGKASVVLENIAIARNNYNNAVAANISGGPFGAGSFMLNPAGGGFAGAGLDVIAMSFGGIPAGKSSVFPSNSQFKTNRTPFLPNIEAPPSNPNINNPLANVQQVSGQFKLEGGPFNGTLYRANNQGKVSSYITYDNVGLAIKRVDVTGADHNGVPTPHVLEYGRNFLRDGSIRVKATGLGDPRPAKPNEIPKTVFIK